MSWEDYSPFGRDPRSVHVTEQDEALLKGEYAHSFRALDWFEVTGRGWIATIEGPDPGDIRGQHVLIDGTPYRVRGIWTVHPYKSPFSLIVTEIEQTRV